MTGKPVVQINNLSKRFGGLHAVKNVSFNVSKNEIVGVIGPNGAGKSTVFNLITGFYRPDSGTVLFNGKNITGLLPNQICLKGIARTFQIARPFGGLTVFDNVLVACLPKNKKVSEARRGVREILDRVMLGHKAESYGKDLTVIERKRLELARVLATDPQVLLLDEVMTGLKPKEMNSLLDLVKELKKSMSLIVVEHVMRAIMSISDRVIVLDFGQKIAEGTPQEIVKNPEVISAYLGGEKLA